MRKILFTIGLFFALSACMNEKQQAEKILQHYIDRKVEMIRYYSMESAFALWNATVSGNEKDYQKLMDIDLEFNKTNQKDSNFFNPDRFSSITQNVFTNEEDFQLLRKLKYSGLITDTLLVRQLNVLYQAFMGPQIEPERYKQLISNEMKLWQVFSVLKIEIDGKKYGVNKIDSIQKHTNDESVRKRIFEAYQQQGRILAPDIIRMVKDRNEFAANFGYPDYYTLSLESKDQTPQKIKLMIDEIEMNTRDQFFEAKQVIDKLLADRFKIPVSELKPWHYNNDRTAYLPERFTAKMDSLFVDIDPIQKTAKFFEGIGLPIKDVIDNSDLEYRPEKSSLTAMINVDFKNDIRLISGIQNTHNGMYRMMHLGGHASHYNSIADDIPYLLKTPIPVIYEGIARYFENLASDYSWLKSELNLNDDNQKEIVVVCQHMQQVEQLFRCRKLLALSEFEQEIYRNPYQDLDSLWYKLNLKYLGVSYPAEKNSGIWAANKFAPSLSCSTHNVLLADVFAAQLQHAIESSVIKQTNGVYTNNKAVGQYLKDNLYRYGNLLPWEKLIEKATGEPLNSMYFVNQLKQKTETHKL